MSSSTASAYSSGRRRRRRTPRGTGCPSARARRSWPRSRRERLGPVEVLGDRPHLLEGEVADGLLERRWSSGRSKCIAIARDRAGAHARRSSARRAADQAGGERSYGKAGAAWRCAPLVIAGVVLADRPRRRRDRHGVPGARPARPPRRPRRWSSDPGAALPELAPRVVEPEAACRPASVGQLVDSAPSRDSQSPTDDEIRRELASSDLPSKAQGRSAPRAACWHGIAVAPRTPQIVRDTSTPQRDRQDPVLWGGGHGSGRPRATTARARSPSPWPAPACSTRR